LLTVLHQHRLQATVTTATGLSHFTNGHEQGLLAAARAFSNGLHPPQLGSCTFTVFAHCPGQAAAIPIGVQQQHLSGFAIAACSTGFLQVSLRTGGKLQMQHQPHIRTIDAHTKSNGGHQHRLGFLLKLLQSQQTALSIHAGVIRESRQSGLTQLGSPALNPTACAAVNQHCTAGSTRFCQHQLKGILGPPHHPVTQVGSLG
tara:strand:- start:580 stop:1185 length:606 start_codon:yes stop_codon:yes gene_type:complete